MLLRKYYGISLIFYLKIVTISCQEENSLAFAIDNTGSMGDDIDAVRRGAKAITDLVFSKTSTTKDIVLVTINDPDSKLQVKTDNRTVFLQHLNQIRTQSILRNDCPEMALSGIETALIESRPESYIFAFTDAEAKDYNKLIAVKTLCQRKQSQVVIVFSIGNVCYGKVPEGPMFTVFYEVAKACSGQVFIIEKNDVDSILKAIEVMLQGKTSIFQWIKVPRTASYVPVKFTLDEKAEYAIVSASGNNVDLLVTTENNYTTPKYEWVMNKKNAKFLKLIDPAPGTYYARVKGTSDVTVVVYGRTDFTFTHGFSVLEPKSLTDTSKQPIAGLGQHLTINVTDPGQIVNIQSVQILDIKDNHIFKSTPLRKLNENLYITDKLVSPNFTFRIAVHGVIKQSGAPIIRYSPNIDPQFVKYIPDSKPVIKIKEGLNVDVNYGSDISLTCEVNAHPAPTIKWYTSSGVLVPSNSSVVDDPMFVSYLKQKNVIKNETYVCKASNTKGSGRDSRIRVGVKPIFTIIGDAVYNAKYGEDAKIPCNIKSYLPITRKWFRSGKQLSGNSGEYSVSPDGSELMLKSMDVGMQDRYICEATLNSDPTKKITNYRNVNITDLVYPKITYATTFTEGKNFSAICRIEGVPKPIISWQFQPKGSKVFIIIDRSTEVLNIPQLKLQDTGVYKCVAKNVLGETKHKFDVVVKEPPIIHNTEIAYYGIEGDLVLKIACNVTGFPDPTIVWKKGNRPLNTDSKYKIQGTTLYINQPVESDSTEYTCEAVNKLGTAKETFVVIIVDSFSDDDNFNGDNHDVYVKEGNSKTIRCNLSNVLKGSVRWYKDGMLTKQTGPTYTIKSTSDDGNYTCRVNTEEGSVSETYIVHVGTSPNFASNIISPKVIDWKNNDEFLDCAADAQPPAMYKWLHNGKEIGAGNDLEQIDITGWGEFTCHVSNIHGNISRNFEVYTSGCYVNHNTAVQNQPLVSDINTLSWPRFMSNNDMKLEKNNEIKLSCPNNKLTANAFKIMPNKKEIIAKCDTQDKFIVDGKTYGYSDLKCINKVESTVLSTGEQCSGPNSEMIRVGFEVNGFLDAYKVCYNKRLSVPLYASVSKYLSRDGGVVDSTKYTWSSAPEIRSSNTGNWKLEGSCKCCYTKGQLLNVNEVAFGPAQAATFKNNLNSVPIWHPCDDSRTSWQTFENIIGEMSFLNENWSSWTGASEYANKDGGLVPRFLWKVIKNEEGTSVIVYVNDKSPVKGDVRCSQSCELIATEDYLYCCNLAEFTEKFGLPSNSFEIN